MNKNYSLITIVCLAFLTFFVSQKLNGQSAVNSDTIKIAAREQNKFVLIKIVPKTMEVINYKHGLNNDPNTFKAPSIAF